ncbi:MAG: hypothetical protein AAB447_02655 [Patescibacteria group bacterium]
MHLEHIFESGHLPTSIIGWIIFIIASGQFSFIAPYVYDAWLVNRRIYPHKYTEKAHQRRCDAIDRLTKYYAFVTKHTCWRNPSGVLNDFGTQVVWMCGISGMLTVIGIFFPTVSEILWVILKISM